MELHTSASFLRYPVRVLAIEAEVLVSDIIGFPT
jgi:hypothetical protein